MKKIKEDKKDTVANTLITSADIALIIMVSLIVSSSFTIISNYVEFVRNNDLLVFSLMEIMVFIGIVLYKRHKNKACVSKP